MLAPFYFSPFLLKNLPKIVSWASLLVFFRVYDVEFCFFLMCVLGGRRSFSLNALIEGRSTIVMGCIVRWPPCGPRLDIGILRPPYGLRLRLLSRLSLFFFYLAYCSRCASFYCFVVHTVLLALIVFIICGLFLCMVVYACGFCYG